MPFSNVNHEIPSVEKHNNENIMTGNINMLRITLVILVITNMMKMTMLYGLILSYINLAFAGNRFDIICDPSRGGMGIKLKMPSTRLVIIMVLIKETRVMSQLSAPVPAIEISQADREKPCTSAIG